MLKKVPTYMPSYGFSQPLQPVKITVAEGITLRLAHEEKLADADLDVYIERRENRWLICVSPDGTDIRLKISVTDDGTIEEVETCQPFHVSALRSDTPDKR